MIRLPQHTLPHLAAITFAAILIPGPPALAAEIAAQPPNILFLFTDDQQADTIAALGNPNIHTPHIDSLVKSGLTFSNAYIMGGSSPAVCSPSRASLLTGLTLWNLENQGMWRFEISDRQTTLPELFRQAGYTTFATGKNEPGQSGHFARAYSAAAKVLFRGMTNDQSVLPLHSFCPDGDYHNRHAVNHTGTHSAELYAEACIRFLQAQAAADKPFYAYVSFQTPHDPRQAPAEYRALYPDAQMPLPSSFLPSHPFDNGMLSIRDERLAATPRTPEAIRRHLADYYATITHTDAQIGRILQALEENGLRDETLIVFASDNGLALGRHGLMGKQNVYEHSTRVPLIIAGPGIPLGEIRDQLCYLFDIYPTLCELAGLAIPDHVEFISLMSSIDDPAAAHRDHLYFAFMAWQRAIRTTRHKLIEYCVDGVRHTQLFDLVDDPDELHNLATLPAHRETLVGLRSLLEQERQHLNDGDTPSPFTDGQGKEFWSTYSSAPDPTSP
jgi:arylsulfatase A-like enzyme